MTSLWPELSYGAWRETCDTWHGHTQVLGKLAVALAPPEPQLQHAALRMTARGWETAPLLAPDGSGTVVVALDLRNHEAIVEVSGGTEQHITLVGERSVGAVCRELLAAVRRVAGDVQITPAPQEVSWSVPLDEDEEHATYNAQEVAAGWWPGDGRYDRAAFYAYAHPAPEAFADATLEPATARWEPALGEYVLDWADVRAADDPHAAVRFAHSAFSHGCAVCRWDLSLGASAEGQPPPVH